MIETSTITTVRDAMWNAVENAVGLQRLFNGKYRDDVQISGLIMQGVSVSDLPALSILPQSSDLVGLTYSQDEFRIPFQVTIYLPPDQWSKAELLIEQVVWAIRNQGDSTAASAVPFINRVCASLDRISGVNVAPGLLQSSATAPGDTLTRPVRCIVASATLLANPLTNSFG